MDAAAQGDERYSKYVEQMQYHYEQDIFIQTQKAQGAFNKLFEYNKKREQERYVQNKVGIGLLQLDLKDIQVIQQLEKETDDEIASQYIRDPLKQQYQLQPVVPAFFQELSADYNTPTEVTFDRESNEYRCSVEKPNQSDFTPQPDNLLQHRTDNRAFFRDVINRVILQNRAQKQLKLIRERILRTAAQDSERKTDTSIMEKLERQEASVGEVSTFINEIPCKKAQLMKGADKPDSVAFFQAGEPLDFTTYCGIGNGFYEQSGARSYEPRDWAAE